MSGKRQKIQQSHLAFGSGDRGEALQAIPQGTEPSMAKRDPESPAGHEQMMEAICDRENLRKALKRVQANKGSSGIDGMTVGELAKHLSRHWPAIREQLLGGTYRPQPVKRVEIPKPDGGMRSLGIPTVLDRFIQQAVLQVLQERWDWTFSHHSYGFRPGRSAHQAVASAQEHVAAGYRWVVDIDLEKFFDRVNHDRRMAAVAQRVSDKRLVRLIRAFLNAGVMEKGLVSPTDEGTPQGGPLSPLLSNLVLDELDRELEKRGHRFVRYADDCNIYVQSERAGHRVMKSIECFIARTLKLKVNAAKSAVARPWERKFLGFTFTANRQPKRRIAPKALTRFKATIRRLTRRSRGICVTTMVEQISSYLRGWGSYYGFCQTPSVLAGLNSWIHRRLRSFQWKQWKRGKRRFAELRRLGVGHDLAAQTAGSPHGPWRISRSPGLSYALPNAFWERLGLPRLTAH